LEKKKVLIFELGAPQSPNLSSLVFVSFRGHITNFSKIIMDALSTEWRSGVLYATGNRVAFKITGSLGVAAFECLQSHISTSDNQPIAGGNAYWKHYPRGFPRN